MFTNDTKDSSLMGLSDLNILGQKCVALNLSILVKLLWLANAKTFDDGLVACK